MIKSKVFSFMQHDAIQRRSLPKRIFHAVCFEGIATAILAPTTAWLMQRSVLEMGGLTILLATTAMIWNIIYNALFDRLWPAHQVRRTTKVRAFHALGFESGFIVIGVSIVAWVLNVSLLQAFTLEIGFFLFFLPYTMLYNWAYDVLRQRIVTRRQQRVSA
ncbi:Na(+)-translocating NADH-quinone reductase subunit E [Salmonella enterica subsp. enterica serovar Montevideo]|nr:Na(+)-translocating NADH-quinone reductase subunit E [Salmonella enterica subsp. enterica serovar Montevideo]EBS5220226.1 Na(+)-translocating NADH-quinone reductase subunit E [Salmonella enterica subsp. enterica serovar Montevideo]EBU7903693.1 Na(+)-translocating NADH-quinone reductase subunit E [Salmonella enterica subsp. enterica serovar Montevideo]EBW5081578.1 Na(+)-translocating NADH-quinone reductase subunit E [Salmonella enterica subsp. enterica serovar Montevideo]MKU22650.1 Na(+)-tran